ncbi:23S rRNA (adenine2503-C2)-methyltransferase [Desulfocicer vacuolatum DSM 3385]|uniref:23S rRNA (Adenine2503-C2)-methyltransferase n=1 Tax=Desulfocicer vacuolatum DSM 3385 TaxID=1121400 RepID=A0A1W1YMZ3_9BACT|nr:23S rRNA (adenine(2503)-C(2))-methyltransferase RlmN [Desulfocicer vacuolatum]SMC37493.1 23S rRNA (adenine2503-C2)-methyltransferase [Desulfocicer vacuolatum DSM 3385]
MSLNILALTCSQITRYLEKNYGKGKFHARALIREIIKTGNLQFQQAREFTNSPRLTVQLEQDLLLPSMEIIDQQEDSGTLKFVTKLKDGLTIESVIIPMKHYSTLCVSTQAGCRMGCIFCETAKQGFHRNLAVDEITGQLFSARFTLQKKIKNIVFMGMGEPFDNLDSLFQAIRVLNDPRGFDMALRHMTVSTCGVIPGIESLARQGMPQINLAVSINSASDKTRSMLMPVNQRYSLGKLKQALLAYPLMSRRVILIEYILIKGINDSPKDAEKLVNYLSGLTVRVNLIAYNPPDHGISSAGISRKRPQNLSLQSVDDNAMHQFAAILEAKGLFVVKRWAKGRSLQAGCGQLSGKNLHQSM